MAVERKLSTPQEWYPVPNENIPPSHVSLGRDRRKGVGGEVGGGGWGGLGGGGRGRHALPVLRYPVPELDKRRGSKGEGKSDAAVGPPS